MPLQRRRSGAGAAGRYSMPEYNVAGLAAEAGARQGGGGREMYVGVRASDFVDFGAVAAAGGVGDGLGLVDCSRSYVGLAGVCSGAEVAEAGREGEVPEGCGIGDWGVRERSAVVGEDARVSLSGAVEREFCFMIQDREYADSVSRVVCCAERGRVAVAAGGGSVASSERRSRRDSSVTSEGLDRRGRRELRFSEPLTSGSLDGEMARGKGFAARRRADRKASGLRMRASARRASTGMAVPVAGAATLSCTKGVVGCEEDGRVREEDECVETAAGKSNVSSRSRARAAPRRSITPEELNDLDNWSDAVSTVGTESVFSEAVPPTEIREVLAADAWIPVGSSFDSKDRLAGFVSVRSAQMVVPDDISESSAGTSPGAPKGSGGSYSGDKELGPSERADEEHDGSQRRLVCVSGVSGNVGFDKSDAAVGADAEVLGSTGSWKFADAEDEGEDDGRSTDPPLVLMRAGAGERRSHGDAAVLVFQPRRSMGFASGDDEDSLSGSCLGKYRLSWSARQESDEGAVHEGESCASDATIPLSDDAYDTFCRNGKDRPRRNSYMNRLVTGAVSERPSSAASSSSDTP